MKSKLFGTQINLPNGVNLSNIYSIRNGKLWAVDKKGFLFFADLNIKPNPSYKPFPEINQCEAIFASNDGEFCLIRTKQQHYHIFYSNLIPYITPIPPGIIITCATFINVANRPKPLVFMGTNLGQVTFFDLNREYLMLSHLPLMVEPPINGLSVVLYQNGYYGLSIVSEKTIHPFILLPDLNLSDSTKPRKPQLPSIRQSDVSCQGNSIALYTNKIVFVFTIKTETLNPRLDQQLMYETFYQVTNEPTTLYTYEDFLFVFTKSGEVQVFFINIQDALITFEVDKYKQFEFDLDSGDLYAISANSVLKITPNFIQDLRSSLSTKFISMKKYEEAAQIITKMPFSSLHEMLSYCGSNLEIRFHLFKYLLAEMRKVNNSITKQQIALAYASFIYYVRVESSKENPDLSNFVNYVSKLRKSELLDERSMLNVLNEYGWDKPIPLLTDSIEKFNFFFERGQYNDCIEYMEDITDENAFYKCALRLFRKKYDRVLSMIQNQNDKIRNSNKIIPILMNGNSKKYVFSLLDSNNLSSVWLTLIFCTYLAKHPDQELVNNFFIEYRYLSHFENEFLIRSMMANRNNLTLANGLMKIQEYYSATVIAAMLSPEYSFDLIAKIKDKEIRKRCATRILRSLNEKDSGIVARYLLRHFEDCGVDYDMVLKYLPDETIGAELGNFVDSFSKNNTLASKEQQENINEALVGASKAAQLISDSKEKSTRLHSTSICSQCKKPFFTESGIVYPCSHLLHVKCANDIIRKFDPKINPESDCPICGFISVSLIDQPFLDKPKGTQADPWSVDPNVLLSHTLQRKKSFPLWG